MTDPITQSGEEMARERMLPSLPGGYGSIVRRQFFRKKWAMAGLCLVVFFFLLAVFAPFLAGNRPLVFKDGEGFRFPVFAAFTAEDFLWFAGSAILPFTWIFCSFLGRARRRRGMSPGTAKAGAKFALACLVVVIMIACLWPERLDRSDYRPIRDGSKNAELCIMPPVPYGPAEIDFSARLEKPGARHWLGADQNGRDLLARLIHGARVSMLIGFVAVSLYVIIGVFLGALAGYFGGLLDLLLCRFMEMVICFPVLFAILAVFCFLPPSVLWIMVLIGLLRWPGVARLTRGEFLRMKNEEYVDAGRALGLSHFRIIFFHMLPNGVAPVLVSATFGIAGAILLESALSFLGLGVQPPTPSWGEMLAHGRIYIEQAGGLMFFPGAAIFLAVTAFNLVGEGLRDALDPKLKK